MVGYGEGICYSCKEYKQYVAVFPDTGDGLCSDCFKASIEEDE